MHPPPQKKKPEKNPHTHKTKQTQKEQQCLRRSFFYRHLFKKQCHYKVRLFRHRSVICIFEHIRMPCLYQFNNGLNFIVLFIQVYKIRYMNA